MFKYQQMCHLNNTFIKCTIQIPTKKMIFNFRFLQAWVKYGIESA
jgi:hypothetical protein